MNQRGSVLMGVLLIIGFSLLVGVPVLQAAQVEQKAAIRDQMDAQAFYLAEAGIEHCRQAALAKLLDLGWRPEEPMETFEDGWFERVNRPSFGPGSYSARAYLVAGEDGTYSIRIESDGIVGGTTGIAKGTRITFPIVTDGSGGGGGDPGTGNAYPLDMTLFASDGIELTGSSWIDGDVITNATDDRSIKMPGTTKIKGDLTLGPGADAASAVHVTGGRPLIDPANPANGAVTGSVLNLSKPRTYLPYVMPTLPEGLPNRGSVVAGWWPEPTPITEDGSYDTITVSNYLKINVGSKDTIRRVRVRNLVVSGGKIILEGEGRLELYVEESLGHGNGQGNGHGGGIGNGAAVNPGGDPNRLSIYYYGQRGFSVGGGSELRANVFVSTADVWVSTDAYRYSGILVSNGQSVDLSGDAKSRILLYAPNADVAIKHSSSVSGAVICRSITILGNSSAVAWSEGVADLYGYLFPSNNGGGSIDIGDGSVWVPTK